MRGGSHQPAPIHNKFKCKRIYLFSQFNLLSYRHSKIALAAVCQNYSCDCLTNTVIKLLF